MAVVTPLFFDTSVLLSGLIDLGPSTPPARRVLLAVAERRLRLVQTAWHCCLEFYAVSTRLPEEHRLSPAEALRLLEADILGRFDIVELPEAARRDCLERAAHERAAGGRLYDVHIAQIARRAGARMVVTNNQRHFASLLSQGIRVIGAEEMASLIR